VVARYVPQAGDVVWMDFDPHSGREQAKRRPALVLTDQSYNRASGLAVVCPPTSRCKPYPFALPAVVDKVEGAILVDHLKSLDWASRRAQLFIPEPIPRY
jgi:mRNA interferase MazF